MKFRDLPEGGTLLSAHRLSARLRVRGAPPAALQALLRGRPSGGSELTLDIDNPDAEPPAPAHLPRASIQLPDGEVISASGGAARIELRPGHGAPTRLVPQCLNLGLAQQWARTGRMMVHGACLGAGDRGVLVLGRKASGKSVLCLAALTAGLRVVSDDWLLLGCDPNASIAERLRDFLMLRESWASRRLRIQWPDAPAAPAPARPKQIIATDRDTSTDPTRFPRTATITDLWL
ncbi:MAG: hypothetical protein ACPGJE_04245, partial [Wenzhouxiangellaceae bacterium]